MTEPVSKPTPFASTIVTMFFDLKKLKGSNATTRSMDFYLEHGKPTLSLPYPMLVFCDDSTVGPIQTIRRSLTDAPTEYVIKSIEDYDLYRDNYPFVAEIRQNNPHYSGLRNTPSYFLMTILKLHFLLLAKQRDDFKTSHYAWIDLGANHLAENVVTYAPPMLDHPNPKVSICYIHYRSHEELQNAQEFLYYGNGAKCGMATTAFTVEREYVDRYHSAVLSIFYEQLVVGLGHGDEQILTYCYDRHPELFHLYYGDYYSTLANYHEPVADIHCIRYHFIDNCIRAGRFDLAQDAAQKVMSVLSRKTLLEPFEMEIQEYLRRLF